MTDDGQQQSREARNALVARLFRDGRSHAEIAAQLGPAITANQVSSLVARLRAAGEDLPARPRGDGAGCASRVRGDKGPPPRRKCRCGACHLSLVPKLFQRAAELAVERRYREIKADVRPRHARAWGKLGCIACGREFMIDDEAAICVRKSITDLEILNLKNQKKIEFPVES